MINVNYIVKLLNVRQHKIPNDKLKRIKVFERNESYMINDENDKEENIIMEKKNNNNNINSINIVEKEQPRRGLRKRNIMMNGYVLDDSFNIIFDKSLEDYYYDNVSYRNRSVIFTFLNSIMYIGSNSFNLNDYDDKEKIIKDFILKIDRDLFDKDLYNKFRYNINRKFNKGDIQMVIKNAYRFISCGMISLFKQYVVDYLGINVYILRLNNSNMLDIENSKYYLSTRFDGNINKTLPNFVIFEHNNMYKPLIMKRIDNDDDTSILCYSKNKEIIDNLWVIFNLKEIDVKDKLEVVVETELNNETKKYKENDIKKLKIEDLRQLCIENKIDIQKVSEKTNKPINKLKSDLINDLLTL